MTKLTIWTIDAEEMKCLQNPTQTPQVKTQARQLTMTDEHKSELLKIF